MTVKKIGEREEVKKRKRSRHMYKKVGDREEGQKAQFVNNQKVWEILKLLHVTQWDTISKQIEAI